MTNARLLELRLTRNPTSSLWELRGGGSTTEVGLLGWLQDRCSIDDGISVAVSAIMARALCPLRMLTFIHPIANDQTASSVWTTTPFGWACVLAPPTWKRMLGRSNIPMIATSDPAIAQQLFSTGDAAWELRQQVVLVSDSGIAPSRLNYRQMERLLGKGPLNRESTRLPQEFTGLILPGIDGDFMELIGWERGELEILLQAIALECAKEHVRWKIVSETEFCATRWYGENAVSGS